MIIIKGVQIDLTGTRFGKLMVTRMAEPVYDKKGTRIYRWYCDCDCGTKDKIVSGAELRRGGAKSCGCLNKETPKNYIDLTGLRFGRLTVIKRVEDCVDKKGKMHLMWECKCDCGNLHIVRGKNLKDGVTKSCGCLKKELNEQPKKTNEYDLSGEYGIGWTSNTNREFYFDLEDYDLIKQRTWNENSNGYARCSIQGKEVLMHRYILNVDDPQIVIDHKKHNTLDNRKSQLRITNTHCNTMNEKLAVNNKSGVTGVCWEDESNTWHSYIWYEGNTIHLGRFNKFEDAVKARKEAEEKYFGEFSYDNSMKGA